MEKLQSISQVAEMLNVSIPTLRFWETEFKQLKPYRTRGGTRKYSEKDIDLIKTIIYLTENKKLTLEGVKQELAKNPDVESRNAQIAQSLKEIKSDLE
ncbi:MAG: MerR family transcriptional regulator, partial [Paludibacter sp.]|nr:MerR family transcriptional regulator [Paludibacter sp.]